MIAAQISGRGALRSLMPQHPAVIANPKKPTVIGHHDHWNAT